MRASALLPPCGSHPFVRGQRHPQHPLRIRCTTPACRQPRYRALRCRRHASARSNNSSLAQRQHWQQQQSQVPRRARIRITAPMFLTLPQVAPPHALPLRTCPQALLQVPRSARRHRQRQRHHLNTSSSITLARRHRASSIGISNASIVSVSSLGTSIAHRHRHRASASASRVAIATAVALAIASAISIAHRHRPPRRASPSASASTSRVTIAHRHRHRHQHRALASLAPHHCSLAAAFHRSSGSIRASNSIRTSTGAASPAHLPVPPPLQVAQVVLDS